MTQNSDGFPEVSFNVAAYTLRIMRDLHEHGEARVFVRDRSREGVQRGRLYNAAQRLGVKICTNRIGAELVARVRKEED